MRCGIILNMHAPAFIDLVLGAGWVLPVYYYYVPVGESNRPATIILPGSTVYVD